MSFYPGIISCYHVSIGGMYVNYGMPTYLINTLYSYIMSSYLHSHLAGYITHVMHVVLHCLVFTSYMDCHLLTCLLYKSYISIISCHHVYIHNIYLNYGMETHLIKTSYSYIISSCLVFILNYGLLSMNVCELWHANLFNKHII